MRKNKHYTKKQLIISVLAVIVVVLLCMTLFACNKESKIETLQLLSFPQNEYNQGDSLNFAGASIIVKYQNGTDEKVMVDSSMISSYNPDKLGDQYIIISYKGKSTAYKVTVNKPKITSVNIDLQPENVNYIEGQNFNVLGAELIVDYENNTQERIPLESSMVSGYNRDLVGTQTLTIRYRETFSSGLYKDHLLNIQVIIQKKEIEAIEVFQVPKITTYFIGEPEPNLEGGVLLIKYNNKYTDTINFTKLVDGAITLNDNLSYSWDSSIAGDNSFVYIKYFDEQKDVYHEARFAVRLLTRDILAYKFLNENNDSEGELIELSQIQNSPFNFHGKKIEVQYNDGRTTETIELSVASDRYIITGYSDDESTHNVFQTVHLQIKYNGIVLPKKIKVLVKVQPEMVSGFELLVPPNELYETYISSELYVDTPIHYKLWKFRYVYNSGNKSEYINVGNLVEIPEFDAEAVHTYTEAGDYPIEALLSGSSLTYQTTITINTMQIEKVELVGNPRLEAYYGDATVDPKDTKIRVKYRNGFYKKVDGSEEISVSSEMIDFNSLTPGTSNATINYFDNKYNVEASVDILINIVNRISSIEIIETPRLTYFINEEFDIQNMVIEFKYANSDETLVREGNGIKSEGFYFTIDGQDDYDFSSFVVEGEVTVLMNYKGMINPIPIVVNVIKKPVQMGDIYYIYGDILDNRGVSFGNVTEGLDINLDNLFIEIMYEGATDFENVKLTSDMLSYKKEDTRPLGNRPITIKYPSEDSATYNIIKHGYNVNVIEKQVIALEIPQGSTPRIVKYTQDTSSGAEQDFIYTGLEIIKRYSNETTEQIQLNNSEFDFTKVNLSQLGFQDIKISLMYDPLVFSYFTIEVVEQLISEVVWDTEASSSNNILWHENLMPTTYVSEGQEIDFTNLYTKREEGYYPRSFDHLYIIEKSPNGNTHKISYSIAKNNIMRVSGYQGEQGPTEQYIKLIYKGLELPVRVVVGTKVLHSIKIDDENISKIVAIAGGEIKIEDTYFTAVFRAAGTDTEDEGYGQSTEIEKSVKLELKHIKLSAENPGGYDKNESTGLRQITIYYEGKTCNIEITVKEKEIESIIVSPLFKSVFIEGEHFSYVSANDPSKYPSLQVNYNNGQTNAKVIGIDTNGDEIIEFPSALELVEEGLLVFDSSSFDSSDFTGTPKTQVIRLRYTSTYGTAFYSYNVIIYDRKNANFEMTIPYDYGESSFVYGDTQSPTFSVNGYSSVLTESGLEAPSSSADTPLQRGYLHNGITRGFYYIFYMPEGMFISTNLAYQALFSNLLDHDILLYSNDSRYVQLRNLTQLPSDVGTYKIVVLSFGDDTHNKFIYDYRSRQDIKDFVIRKRDIYIKVAEKSKIYGQDMPEMLIELRTAENVEILNDPMLVFAQQDRELGFKSPGFVGNNTQLEKTLVKISDNIGNPIVGSTIYDCFDIVYTLAQTQKRKLDYNERVGGYVVTINPVLTNANYNLHYMLSHFEINKRKINVYPKLRDGLWPTWQHGQIRPAIEYDTSKLNPDQVVEFGISSEDSGILSGDVLTGSLSATLNLEENLADQLLPKSETENSKVIGYTRINIGTLTPSANRNYDIILNTHTVNSNDEVYVKYLQRTIYIKVKPQVRVYGSVWDNSKLSLIVTKTSSGDINEEDAFAPTSNNQRETIADIGSLRYSYFIIDSITGDETAIEGINSSLPVGTVEVRLTILEQGIKFDLYDINFVKSEIRTTRRKVMVVPNSAMKIFGQSDPVFTYSTSIIPNDSESGLLPSDNLSGEGKLTRVIGENVGKYRILLGNLSDNNFNYDLVLGKNQQNNLDAVLTIEKQFIYIGFTQGALHKEYDGLIGKLSKSDSIVYVKDAGDNYVELDSFDKNKFNITLRQRSKSVGEYDILASSLDPNYQVFLKDEHLYEIYQKVVDIQLFDNNIVLESNSIIEFSPDGHVLNFEVLRSQIVGVYDETGQPEIENGQLKLDEVDVSLSISLNDEEMIGNIISNVGTYVVTPVATLSNANYKLRTPISSYIVEVVAKTLLVVLKDADAQTHIFSKIYNGKPIEITESDYEVTPLIPYNLRPELLLGIEGSISAPKNVLVDEQGNIMSYPIGITKNSNNPNYIYKLFYEDYEYRIDPKVVYVEITNTNLQQSYNGRSPFIKEFTARGTVEGDTLNTANVYFSFAREANDNRLNSDAGRYQVSARSLDTNYSINLNENYVFTIVPTTTELILNKTSTYDPLKKEYTPDNLTLPYLLQDDFLFSESIAPTVLNFVGENSKSAYKEKLNVLTVGVLRVRSSYYALNILGSKEALENGIHIVKSSINDIAYENYIKYYEDFPNTAADLFDALNTLRSRLDELAHLYDEGSIAMNQKFEELLVFVNNASTLIDRENNFITFTFEESDFPIPEEASDVVNSQFVFTFESHGHNTIYRWTQSNFVRIVKKQLLIKVYDTQVKYGEYEIGQDASIIYEVLDSKDNIFDITLSGTPKRKVENKNVGSYEISIDEIISDPDNIDKYIISLHHSTPSPKYHIIKNNVTVILLPVGLEGDLIYGTLIGESTINRYKYFDIYDEINHAKARDYYRRMTGETGEVPLQDLKDYFGKLCYQDIIASDQADSVINTTNAEYGLYLKSEFQAGNLGNNKIGLPGLDSGYYSTVAIGYSSANYNVRVVDSDLLISRATAQLETAVNNTIIREYASSFNLTFNFPGLASNESTDLILYSLESDSTLSEIGRISENNNLFIRGDNANIVTDLHTNVSQNLSEQRLYLTNEYNQLPIVTKNYIFEFLETGYNVFITKKVLEIKVTDMQDNQEMFYDYGTFDHPFYDPSDSTTVRYMGSDRNGYKIHYLGFADWDATNIQQYSPGQSKAPVFNLYGTVQLGVKAIGSSEMSWPQVDSDAILKNYMPVVLPGTTITTEKREVEIEINPDKLKTAFSFYSYDNIMGLSTTPMTIYPHYSETTYNIINTTEKEMSGYKLIGGSYGPMDFNLKVGSTTAYGESLHAQNSDILQRGGYVAENSPYVYTKTTNNVEKIGELHRPELLFSHKITVTKTETGWKVLVSGFNPTSNYSVEDQVINFSEAEVNYIYQKVDIAIAGKNIFYDTDYATWKDVDKFPYYLLDTSLDSQMLNYYFYFGAEGLNFPNKYKFNLGNNTHPRISQVDTISPNSVNTVYGVNLQYTHDSTGYFNTVDQSLYTDYLTISTETGSILTASEDRQTTLENILKLNKSLPLIFKERTSATMQDIKVKEFTTLEYGFDKLQHDGNMDTYFQAVDDQEQQLMSSYDKLSITFRARKIDDFKKPIGLAFILSHTITNASGQSNTPGYTRTKKHSVLMLRMNKNHSIDGNNQYYLEESAKNFSLEYIVYYEIENQDNHKTNELFSAFSSAPFEIAYDIFDGYLHTFNFYHDKSKVMLYIELDNSRFNAISLSTLSCELLNGEIAMFSNARNSLELSDIYPGPVSFGLLSSKLDIQVKRISTAYQGFFESSGSKLVISPNFKYLTNNSNLGYDDVIDNNLINSQDIQIKYYLNGQMQPEDATSYSLLPGSNKIEVYAYSNNDLIDRLMSYIYFANSTYSSFYKTSDYRVTYDTSTNSTTTYLVNANSFYFDGLISDGNSKILLENRYDNFYAALDDGNTNNKPIKIYHFQSHPEDEYDNWHEDPTSDPPVPIVYDRAKTLIASKEDFISDSNPFFALYPIYGGSDSDPYSYNEIPNQRDRGKTFAFEPIDNNVSSFSMTFQLFNVNYLENLRYKYGDMTGDIQPTDEIHGGFAVRQDVSKVSLRMFYNNNSNRSILVTNEGNESGIYYEEGLNNWNRISTIDFKAYRNYRIVVLKSSTGSSILVYEDDVIVAQESLDSTRMSSMGNKFESRFIGKRAIIKDVLFNYCHDINQDRILKVGDDTAGYNLILNYENEDIDALATDKKVEEYRNVSERDILDQGFAKIKYKYNSIGANSNTEISIDSLIKEGDANSRLIFNLTNNSLTFKYLGSGGNLSANQSKTINLVADADYSIIISFGETEELDASSLSGLVNISSGNVSCSRIIFNIDGTEHIFYMPDKSKPIGQQSEWSVKYNYNIASCYIMRMNLNNTNVTISDFGMCKYKNFVFGNWTLLDKPKNEL